MASRSLALAAALSLGLGLLAPTESFAQHRRDHSEYGPHDHYSGHDRHRGRRHYYRDDNDDEAIAAGVIGLVLGLTLGSLAAQSQDRPGPAACYDNYRRCAPSPYAREPLAAYDDSGLDGGYDPRYDNRRSAYERDYGVTPQAGSYAAPRQSSQCVRRERQWDRYAERYVVVDVPC